MGPKNRVVLSTIITGALSVSLLGLATSPAFADNGTTTQVSYSQSSSNTTDQTLSVASTDVKGKVTLEYRMKNGYRTSAKCVHVTKYSQIAGKKCIIPAKGMKFLNTGNGRVTKGTRFNDYIGSKYTPVGTKFYWDAKKKVWREEKCGNESTFKTPHAKLNVAQVAEVKSFSDYTVSVKSTSKSTGTANALAFCKTETSSASGSGSSTSTAIASATASATGKTVAIATANASKKARAVKSAITGLTISEQSQADVKAYTSTQASATASAQAVCSSTTPPPFIPPTTPPVTPPTPPTPPVDHAPTVGIYASPAHLYPNGNVRVFIQTADSDGDTVELSLGATNGYVTGKVKVDTQWNGTACPSGTTCWEATAWAGNTPGTMVVTATATSNGKTATDSVSFPIVKDEF